MADHYQFLRGDTEQNEGYTGPEGSITMDLEAKTLRLHDGETQGGKRTLNLDDLASYATSGDISDFVKREDFSEAAFTQIGTEVGQLLQVGGLGVGSTTALTPENLDNLNRTMFNVRTSDGVLNHYERSGTPGAYQLRMRGNSAPSMSYRRRNQDGWTSFIQLADENNLSGMLASLMAVNTRSDNGGKGFTLPNGVKVNFGKFTSGQTMIMATKFASDSSFSVVAIPYNTNKSDQSAVIEYVRNDAFIAQTYTPSSNKSDTGGFYIAIGE